ncbi:nitrite reductase [Domibacillus antri]|uniref:Nitrite reductase n=1 Tax=Domibacillus antri TaxID=1714264 RepID=A0A1Q8Q9B6_9BACI|nr:nitrite reductase small subunit NirD [Domibacillus antri]OLN23927.1 nitrite reductase [Domibacillus antri]
MEKTIEKVKAASFQEMPEKIGQTIRIGSVEIALFKLADGHVRAIENRCPHKGGVLAQGIVSGEHVFCPMHDWRINTTDGKAAAPDHGCVKTYDVKIEGDDVYIFV